MAGARVLVLAAHGERNVADPNRALFEHAEALAERLAPLSVLCGHLNGEPRLEAALEVAGTAEVLIYPVFMADGYFVSKILKKRLRAALKGENTTVMTPLGSDPGLAGLMMANALRSAEQAGFASASTRLLIAGHGSKIETASAQATHRIARELGAMGKFADVGIGLLEEPPFIADQLAAATGPVVVSGFFAGNGMHSTRDVPGAIEDSGARAVYTGPIGVDPAIRDLIEASVRSKLAKV